MIKSCPVKSSAKALFILIFLGLPAVGCTFNTPPKTRLPQNLPDQWGNRIKGEDLPVTASLMDLFKDETLNALVKEALDNNPDLCAAALRIESSRVLLNASGADLLPTVNVSGSRGRNNRNLDPSTGAAFEKNQYQAALTIGWEIDIWGRLLDLQTRKSELHHIRTLEMVSAYDSLAARTIQVWIGIIAADRLAVLQEKRINILNQLEETILERYAQGLGDLDELSAARTRTFIAQSEERFLKENRDRKIRRMEVLLGRYPETKMSPDHPLPEIKRVRIEKPFTHLLKRPDIQMALTRVDAQNLAVLAAHKARLPRLNLSYERSRESSSLSRFQNADILWNLIAGTTLPLFEGGRLINEAQAAQIEAKAEVKALKAVVLKALREIEDLMGRENGLQVREELLQTALKETQKTVNNYRTRYQSGLINLPDLLNAVTEQMDIEAQLLEMHADRIKNRIDLALALGVSV